MRKPRFWLALLAFGTLLPSAHAQYGYADQSSRCGFNLTVTNNHDVRIRYLGSGGPYVSLTPDEGGAGVNDWGHDQEVGRFVSVWNYSECEGPPGWAHQGHGNRYVIELTNTGRELEFFTLALTLTADNEDFGDAISVSSGGVTERGGSHFGGSETLTIDRSGRAFNAPVNMRPEFEWDQLGFYTEASVTATGQWEDELLPRESVVITIWTQGSSAVNRRPRTP